MKIDINLIGNILIAMFLYNAILKSLAMGFFKQIMKTDTAKKKAKNFKEELKKKLDE